MTDFHVHSRFCDGESTPKEIIEKAKELGLETLGIVVHSPMYFEPDYDRFIADAAEFRKLMANLKHACGLRLLCGVEQDYFSACPADGYDYIIGSIHYVKTADGFIPVDYSEEKFCDGVERGFGGDYAAFAAAYYDSLPNIASLKPDIIGHFNLVSKFNKDERYFKEDDPRVSRAWRRAADALLALRVPFEINTGAISRGYTDKPYPTREQALYIKERGGSFILSSDSHAANTLCFGFDFAEKWAKELDLRLVSEIEISRA